MNALEALEIVLKFKPYEGRLPEPLCDLRIVELIPEASDVLKQALTPSVEQEKIIRLLDDVIRDCHYLNSLRLPNQIETLHNLLTYKFPNLCQYILQPNKAVKELHSKYDWLLNTCDHLGGTKTSIGLLNTFEEFKAFRKGILELLKEIEGRRK